MGSLLFASLPLHLFVDGADDAGKAFERNDDQRGDDEADGQGRVLDETLRTVAGVPSRVPGHGLTGAMG